MCFTGSFLFALYLAILYLFGEFLNSNWKYHILRLVLFFFLAPLGLFKLLIRQSLPSVNFRLNNDLPILITSPDSVYANIVLRTNAIIVFVWLSITSGIFIWQQLKYIRFKKKIMVSMTEITDSTLLNYLNICRKNIGIKRKVKVFQSEFLSPFTTGVCVPVIVMPAYLPFEKQKLIIKHELIHIKRYDFLIQFLRRLVTCFYWFNPLVYILDVQLEKIVEISCDRSVILDMGQKEKKDYAMLIIDMASYDIQYRSVFISSFSRNVRSLKERMNLIMRPEKKYGKGLPAVIIVFMVLCSSFTAFAYQPPTKLSMNWNSSVTSLPDFNSADRIVFESGNYFAGQAFPSIRYDTQFTDINGNVYKIEDFPDSHYAACEHDFVEGTYSMHSKKADGSCITKYYEAQRCSKCGHLEIGSLIDTETHDVCPHK